MMLGHLDYNRSYLAQKHELDFLMQIAIVANPAVAIVAVAIFFILKISSQKILNLKYFRNVRVTKLML